jgi:hypothetical protein
MDFDVFCFEKGPRENPQMAAKTHPLTRENQTTLGHMGE